MDNSYFGDRALSDFQNNYRLNSNHLNIYGQQPQQRHNDQHQQEHEHQPLSPGQSRSRGSSFTGSPTSPTSAHRSTVSQPSATQLQPGYFAIGTTGALQTTLSPVTSTYDLSRSPSMNAVLDYGYRGSYSRMSMHDESGPVRPRNNSEYMVNPMPTPRHSTSGSISLSGLQFPQQISLAGLNDSVYSAPTTIDTRSPLVSTPIPCPFPTVPSPPSNTVPAAKKTRRARSSHANDEPIGYVYADKSRFKCNKSECKDLQFGRMADLRRHHDQTHAKNRVQYFCGVSGCSRSHASTGGRGRSFGTRKDKRDEHERNVHKKERESSYSSSESV